jgi:hypothetical protein
MQPVLPQSAETTSANAANTAKQANIVIARRIVIPFAS